MQRGPCGPPRAKNGLALRARRALRRRLTAWGGGAPGCAVGGLTRSRSHRRQRLVQVFQQVVDVLDANRQPHHVGLDAGFGQLGGIELAVGG